MNERYQRQDFGHLQIDVTFTDPSAYAKPLSLVVSTWSLQPIPKCSSECAAGSDHWVGRAADTLSFAVDVAPDVLATYVGAYSGFWDTLPRKVEVAISGGQLVAIIDDDGQPVRLVPLSHTLFESSDGLGHRFVRNGGGAATYVVEIHVSGDYQYERRR